MLYLCHIFIKADAIISHCHYIVVIEREIFTKEKVLFSVKREKLVRKLLCDYYILIVFIFRVLCPADPDKEDSNESVVCFMSGDKRKTATYLDIISCQVSSSY